jgi:transcriptional antiterminator
MKEEILLLRSSGLSIREIAKKLQCSEFKVKYHLYERLKVQQLKKNKSIRIERKRRIVDYLGGKCRICSYNRSLSALELHHLDPKSKHEKLKGKNSSLFSQVSNWEDLKREADKCALLCANCHREVHDGLIDL